MLAVGCAYGPSRRFCDGVLKRYGVATRYVPATAMISSAVATAGT